MNGDLMVFSKGRKSGPLTVYLDTGLSGAGSILVAKDMSRRLAGKRFLLCKPATKT